MLCSISFPDWIQSICAIATLILAIVIAVQQKNIKTLTDVVNSLNEQAKVSQQLLAFEMRSRINDIQPNFITSINRYNINHFIFSFKNVGQRARNISFEKLQNMDTLNIDNPGNKVVTTGNSVSGNYTLTKSSTPFLFKINYEDNNGTRFFQIVNGGSNNQLTVNLPEKG